MKPPTNKPCRKTQQIRISSCLLSFSGIFLSVLVTPSMAGMPDYDKTPAQAIVARQSQKPDLPDPGNSVDSQQIPGLDPDMTGEPTETLVLPQALMLALTNNPELGAFSQEIRAREATVLQANLLPNPEFGVNASNFGNNRFQGFDAASVTLQLSQLIELGGKRAARTEAATLAQELANWDYESKRIEVLTQVTRAFIAVLAAQKSLALQRQLQNLARQVSETTVAQMRAGSVTAVEVAKARVALASSRIAVMRAERELQAARKRLAAGWGNTTPHFQAVAGDLETIREPPPLEALLQRLEKNPDLARWATEISQRQALIAVEKSKAIPNVTVTLGTNQYLDGNDFNMMADLSIPLPVFDRNQGRILAAERRLGKAQSSRRNSEVRISTALHTTYQRLLAAYTAVITLREDIIPGAQSAYDATRRGYRLGRFDFLNLLDAQRTLFGVKTQYLRELADYHFQVAELERLIGGALQTNPETFNK